MSSSQLLAEYRSYVAPVLAFDKRVITGGCGSYLVDEDGNRYLDMSAGQFCAIMGHGEAELAAKVASLSKGPTNVSVNFLCKEVLHAAKAVHDICPEMNGKVFFLSTGAEANECCLRYAKQMSGHRNGIISFDVGYHGLSLGTEGYSMGRQYVKPSLANSFFIKAPRGHYSENADKAEWQASIHEMEKILECSHSEIAAAIFEPIVSTGGLLYPPKEFWREIRQLCNQYKIFLVFDECQTGFGRTGTWFYYQQLEDCVPDFLVCAKGMGLGYPVSMVVFNGNTFPISSFVMNHVSSHQNDPFGAGLVRFGIQEIEKNGYLTSNLEKGKYILKRLQELARKYPAMQDPRMCGLMGGFDIDFQSTTKNELVEKSRIFCEFGLKNGIILQFGNYGETVRLLPPYSISYEEIDYFVLQLEKTLMDLSHLFLIKT